MPKQLSQRAAIILCVTIGVFVLALFAVQRFAAVPTQTVTINARDETGAAIDPVNVWRDYSNRGAGIAGQVHNGERVGLLRVSGGAALIRLPSGSQGWVNEQFIKR